jgi:PTS system nitrogen regulatory IIA component
MELKIKDIVNLLQVSEKTVYRWIKGNKIPCYRINHQYRFNRSEINEWILSNKIEFSSSLVNLDVFHNPDNLSKLLEKGGIVVNIKGNTVKEILSNAIEMINTPTGISKQELLSVVLSREELMPTAIGKGISIPHPRNPIITNINDASVSICILEKPIEFGALDGEPVHTLFIILTTSPRMHLEVLSKISYLCQDDNFLKMLKERESKEKILEYVRSKEKTWKNNDIKKVNE